MQGRKLETAFFTAEFLIKFFMALDVKLPGNAHNFSSSYGFEAFKSILEYAVLAYTKLAYRWLGTKKHTEEVKGDDKSVRNAKAQEVLNNIRKIIFELSEEWQTKSFQITGLLLLIDCASTFKSPAFSEQSRIYYTDYSRKGKLYQDFLTVYNEVHYSGENMMEKEIIAALKLIDKLFTERHKAKEGNILEKKMKKIEGKISENENFLEIPKQDENSKANSLGWVKIVYPIGSDLERELVDWRKKRKGKFCSLMMKYLTSEYHKAIMGHLMSRMSDMDYFYFAIISLMSVQKYRKSLLLAEVIFFH
eukprot:TRINITY_DN11165_c0_g4_i1.p1 TRINITY_DN11165_c0_g4~~TRINITY_DN11165_c0_g4_i1.p1  ORF type:complete len:306 (+),score=102.19 TRINITY_DN11165_c0_g4_i1:587-1504(+)